MTLSVEVTPTGHDIGHWAGSRAAADRLDLADLLAELGFITDLGIPGELAGVPGAELLVVAAHPDDETLGLGRLIHSWSRAGGTVSAVVATAGEACFDHVGVQVAGLAERRLAEWQAATTILGVRDQQALLMADGALADAEPDLTAALAGEVARRLEQSTAVVLAAPWRHDPHPDHRAVGRVVQRLGEQYEVPVLEFGVWMTYWSDPGEVDADERRLAVLVTDDDDEQAFQRACAEFVTQLRPLDPGLGAVVPPAMLAHLSEQLVLLPRKEARR